MLKAKELILDFFNFAFLLSLVSFFITFFIIGDRFLVFGSFLRSILPFTFFGILFLIIFKVKRKIYVDLNGKSSTDEIVAYISPQEIFIDKIISVLMAVAILAVSYFNHEYNLADIPQSVLSFLYIYIWHRILFKPKDDMTGVIALISTDKIKDELAIFLLLVLISGLGMLKPQADITTDILQAIIAYLVMLFWHHMIFNQKDN